MGPSELEVFTRKLSSLKTALWKTKSLANGLIMCQEEVAQHDETERRQSAHVTNRGQRDVSYTDWSSEPPDSRPTSAPPLLMV